MVDLTATLFRKLTVLVHRRAFCLRCKVNIRFDSTCGPLQQWCTSWNNVDAVIVDDDVEVVDFPVADSGCYDELICFMYVRFGLELARPSIAVRVAATESHLDIVRKTL